MPIASAVESYLWQHHRQQSLRGRAYDTIPPIRSTAEIAKGNDRSVYGDAVILKRTWWQKIILYFFLLYAANCAVLLLGGTMHMQHDRLPRVLLCVSIAVVVLGIVWERLNRGNNRWNIVIDQEGIRLGSARIYWADTAGVYIMKKRSGKRTYEYLVLLGRTGTVREYDLRGFYVPEQRLAFAVEHYKTLRQLGISRDAPI